MGLLSRAFWRGRSGHQSFEFPVCSKELARNCIVGTAAQWQVSHSLLQLFDVEPNLGGVVACNDDMADLFGFRRVHSKAFSPTRQSGSAVKPSYIEAVNRECNTDPCRRVLQVGWRTPRRIVSPCCNSSNSHSFCILLVGRAELDRSGTLLQGGSY